MRKPCSVNEISNAINGSILQKSTKEHQINYLSTDSRKFLVPEESLFFAIVGEKRDGHSHLLEAYKKGVRCFIVSKSVAFELKEASIILVKNTVASLQLLAKKHREDFTFPIIGITGSNGKTICKEWVYQLLKEDKNIVRNPKSYNSQIGVPLSVWNCEEQNNLGVFEAGISLPGEMIKLEKIIQPNIGLFTCIGSAHEENFVSLEQKIAEKLLLFKKVKTLIYCSDYSELSKAISESSSLQQTSKFNWSKKDVSAKLYIESIQKNNRQTVIIGCYGNEKQVITIPFYDDASIENAINCWSLLLVLNYSLSFIQEQMKSLEPIAMRLELGEGDNNCSIIRDYYNSDLNSLEIALDFLEQQKQHIQKTVVLSDILQTKNNGTDLYKKVNNALLKKGVTRLVGIGPEISKNKKSFSINSTFFNSTEDYLSQQENLNFSNETILLKGARLFEFEKINATLEKKTHRTVLEVNLNALQHNLTYFKSKIKPTTKIMVMVKALSYGSGSFEIANLLQFNKVDYLGVAYLDEGIALRKAGIKLPIMVMSPEPQAFDLMIKYQLEPEIYNHRTLHLFSSALENCTDIQTEYPIHLKFDTGMHRLGFEIKELKEILSFLAMHKKILVKSVFSHLATSDDVSMKQYSLKQIERFKSIKNDFIQNDKKPPLFHLLNSAGILAFPDAQFDLVRLGIGLYGVSPIQEFKTQLEQVSELKTSISQIKEVPVGDAVGYGRMEIAKKKMRIATVPIGYADGFRRSLGNRVGFMFVNNQKAEVVGNVCMDMCMLDVTNISAKEGDEVIVFGKIHPVEDFARNMKTIPYEALTSISPRVKRVYFQD